MVVRLQVVPRAHSAIAASDPPEADTGCPAERAPLCVLDNNTSPLEDFTGAKCIYCANTKEDGQPILVAKLKLQYVCLPLKMSLCSLQGKGQNALIALTVSLIWKKTWVAVTLLLCAYWPVG
jgi:hypothetical protein